MGAGAPIGNTNAEKWSLEASKELLEKALVMCDEKEMYKVHGSDIEGYKYDFIGEITRALGIYHSLITRDIKNRHKELSTLINRLINNLESNCYSNTKKGIINTAVGIVNLKSNHKWTDRVDTTTQGDRIDQNKPLTPEQKQALRDELDSEY